MPYIHWVIKMFLNKNILNENSTRRDILNWIKTDPSYFLHEYSDKPWAQSYIDKAAKEAAKEESFLYQFSDKPWAQPYIDEAAKNTANKYPKLFLEKWADRFPHYINLALFALE